MSAAQTPLRVTADAGDWSASHDGRGTSSYVGILAGDEVVAIAVAHDAEPWSSPDPRPIANRIVKCVNSHDALVEALEAARNGLQWYRDSYPEAASQADDEAMEQIDAALRAATGEAAS